MLFRIKQLVDDLKSGSRDNDFYSQIDLLYSLVKSSLLSEEKIKTEEIIQDLTIYCTEGVAANNSNAILISAQMHYLGIGYQTNFNKTIELLNQLITLGNVDAMYGRGFMHERGQGSDVDFPAAIRLYEQAIALGHASAMFNRAFMHQTGRGGTVDFPAAIELYEQAIVLGDTTAMYNRAFMHKNGLGGEVDFPSAILLYEQAIARDNADAMNNRALMHKNGLGGAVDYPSAILLYEKAIARDNTDAMSNRAFMHEQGLGGEVDYPAAIRLYERAIAMGNTCAMFNRALMHEQAQGGPKDITKAARLYRLAADNNCLQAINRLNYTEIGIFYYHHAMSQTNIVNALELTLNNPELVAEFIEYDCKKCVLADPKNLEHIEQFIVNYGASTSDKCAQNKLCESILTALHDCELDMQGDFDHVMQFKKYHLSKLHITNIKVDNIPCILQMIINTWYYFTNKEWTEETTQFTKNAAEILSKMMYRLKLLEIDSIAKPFLRNIALILVKNMLGKKHGLSMAQQVSVSHVMRLIAFQEETHTVDELNSFLRAKGLIIQNPTAKLRNMTFFDANTSGMSFHKSKKPCTDIPPNPRNSI